MDQRLRHLERVALESGCSADLAALEVARERAGLAERAAPPARPELPPRRQRRLEPQLALFKRRYARKRPTKRSGGDPNDRRYSRRLEAKIRRMDPLELDELLNGPYD